MFTSCVWFMASVLRLLMTTLSHFRDLEQRAFMLDAETELGSGRHDHQRVFTLSIKVKLCIKAFEAIAIIK